MTSDKDVPHNAINSDEQENKYTFGCNQVSFILNKIRPFFCLFVFRGDWTAQPSLFVPTRFLSFLGEWCLNLCTIYTSRPDPTLNLPDKVSIKKISHLFYIYK